MVEYHWYGNFGYTTTADRDASYDVIADYISANDLTPVPYDGTDGVIVKGNGVVEHPDPLPSFQYSYTITDEQYFPANDAVNTASSIAIAGGSGCNR